MEKRSEEWAGAAVWVATAAAVGDVAEEEVAGLPACGWNPEKMAEGDLAEMEDSREVERRGVEAEGEWGGSETVDGDDGEEIAAPSGW